jgi:hypothetical protein
MRRGTLAQTCVSQRPKMFGRLRLSDPKAFGDRSDRQRLNKQNMCFGAS